MQRVAIFEYKVQPLDVDFNESIRTTQLLGYLLHAAGKHAEENGLGIHKLHGKDKAWVATRLAMEVYKYPISGEIFRIETWIEDYGRIFTTRNFSIKDTDDNVIGAGSSIWCMLDMNTRKVMELSSLEDSELVTGIAPAIKKPAKVPLAGGEAVSRHRVKYSDIDFNRHANSMKYIEWMIDLMPLEFFEKKEIRRIDVNYVNELRFGDKVDIFSEQNKPDRCLFDMKRMNEEICKVEIKFDGPFDLVKNK